MEKPLVTLSDGIPMEGHADGQKTGLLGMSADQLSECLSSLGLISRCGLRGQCLRGSIGLLLTGMAIGLGTQLDQSRMAAFGCLANQQRLLKSLRPTNPSGPATGRKASLNDRSKVDLWDATFTESLNRGSLVESGKHVPRRLLVQAETTISLHALAA